MPQVQQLADVMMTARQGCYSIAMQCYQQLYPLLGDVETDVDASAVLTVAQSSTIAVTLRGEAPQHTA